MYMYMYVCMYVCTYVCMYVCRYVHTYIRMGHIISLTITRNVQNHIRNAKLLDNCSLQVQPAELLLLTVLHAASSHIKAGYVHDMTSLHDVI